MTTLAIVVTVATEMVSVEAVKMDGGSELPKVAGEIEEGTMSQG